MSGDADGLRVSGSNSRRRLRTLRSSKNQSIYKSQKERPSDIRAVSCVPQSLHQLGSQVTGHRTIFAAPAPKVLSATSRSAHAINQRQRIRLSRRSWPSKRSHSRWRTHPRYDNAVGLASPRTDRAGRWNLVARVHASLLLATRNSYVVSWYTISGS
jgi:hypothetical protein